MIKLEIVKQEERDLLWNINQKYLYEMTKYYPDEMDENGNYQYGYFDNYFIDSNRKALFINNDSVLIGFVFINPYSYINHTPDNVIAEFTIFPSYRRKHYAEDAVKMILELFPGKWEIKYNEMNEGAKKLWTKISKPYCPKEYKINENEIVLEFSNK